MAGLLLTAEIVAYEAPTGCSYHVFMVSERWARRRLWAIRTTQKVVRAAARRSLAARGVRLYRATIRDAQAGGWSDPWSWELGVADPAARSVRMRHFHADDSPVEKLSESVVRRWSWLDDGAPAPAPGPRFRPGLLLRLAERFEKDRAPEPEARGRPWMVTELWDYGCEVEISPPGDLIDRSRTSMRTIAADLWRKKRDYERHIRADRPPVAGIPLPGFQASL